MEINKCVLNTAYFPPVEYFVQLITHKKIFIEGFDNYAKQSYRNRCYIYSPNGKLPLVIPISKEGAVKKHSNKVSIINKIDWQKNHQKTLATAYNNSPYFLYYKDDIFSLLENATSNLFNFNLNIIKDLCKILGISYLKIEPTSKYFSTYCNEVNDCRDKLHPKKKNIFSTNREMEYFQVFSDKYGFIYNLSILDLLFNEGPQSIDYLNKLIISQK